MSTHTNTQQIKPNQTKSKINRPTNQSRYWSVAFPSCVVMALTFYFTMHWAFLVMTSEPIDSFRQFGGTHNQQQHAPNNSARRHKLLQEAGKPAAAAEAPPQKKQTPSFLTLLLLLLLVVVVVELLMLPCLISHGVELLALPWRCLLQCA